MYIGHGHLCVCLSLAAFPHYCTDPDVSWGNGRGCPLVVHHWADLQSVHGFRCYDNIAPNAKCQRVLVLALCLFIIWPHRSTTYVDAAYCYRPSTAVCRSVCLSVCRPVTLVSPAKMAKPIKMPFGSRTRVGSRNHVLDGG